MKLLITVCLFAVIANATVSYKKLFGDPADSCIDVTFVEADCAGDADSKPLKEVIQEEGWEAGVCGDDFSTEGCDLSHQELLHDMTELIEKFAGSHCTDGKKPDYTAGCKHHKAAPLNSHCPASDFQHLECEPTTCADWKVAFHDFGCAMEVSECVEDYLQGELKCNPKGENLQKISSKDRCNDEISCTIKGEFCNFGKSSEHDGTCELCDITFCDHLETSDAGRAVCVTECGNQCTPNPECDDSCSLEPKTCSQLKLAMKKGGCGETCKQCYIDMFNRKLECSGEHYVFSQVDGSSASAFSLMMLAFVAIYQF